MTVEAQRLVDVPPDAFSLTKRGLQVPMEQRLSSASEAWDALVAEA